MIIGIPDGHNVVAGREQGYKGLPMRVGPITTALKDGRAFDTTAMVTRWVPTRLEREAIARGEDVYVRMLGTNPPPMSVGVGDPDEPGNEW